MLPIVKAFSSPSHLLELDDISLKTVFSIWKKNRNGVEGVMVEFYILHLSRMNWSVIIADGVSLNWTSQIM